MKSNSTNMEIQIEESSIDHNYIATVDYRD